MNVMKSSNNLPKWKRTVIKVGSSLIAPEGRNVSSKYILPIANFISQSIHSGKEVILVSSGAVAAGISTQQKFINKLNKSIQEKQALASIGQSILIQHWSRFFDFPCAQILLTHEELKRRKFYINAKNTLNQLIHFGTLPIVNENDSVAVEELNIGDNDNLAAHVAALVEADLLIICSDINGLYDADPSTNKNAKLINVVNNIDESIYSLASKSINPISKGGMITKIEAAEKAITKGIDTIIVNGKNPKVFEKLIAGNIEGTLFRKNESKVNAKKHWLMHNYSQHGKIIIDSGAEHAIIYEGASLLPTGIIEVQEHFNVGDTIEIHSTNNIKLGSGITAYSSNDLLKVKGMKSDEIKSITNRKNNIEVIHRSDLVINQKIKEKIYE